MKLGSYKFLAIGVIIISICTSCLPEKVKTEMGEAMKEGQYMAADMQFKKAISNIELHKVRTGTYPETLHDIQFLAAYDSTFFSFVTYTKLDSVYELNMTYPQFLLGDDSTSTVDLNYPAEFWKGLGCIKSNMME